MGGAVDQDVDSAERLFGLLHSRRNLGFVSHIAWDRDGAAPHRDYRRGALFGVLGVDVDADQVGPFFGQALGDPAHDIGAGAGNHGDLPLKFHGVYPLSAQQVIVS